MTNAELIKALRCELYGDDECDKSDCPLWSELGCRNGIANRAAADALEAADKRIDGLQKLVDINTERCEALRKQLRESHESYERHIAEQQEQIAKLYILLNNRINEIAELEAQLPKEGEWITADNPPKNEGLYLVGLSVGWDNEYVVRLARYTKDLSEALFSSNLSGDGWYRWDGDNDCDVICHPKYWMELPEPPNCGAKMKGANDE